MRLPVKYLLVAFVAVLSAMSLRAEERASSSFPDLELIKAETADPESRYYYPELLRKFMSNDTVMTDNDYRYFYYGTLFQEDYDPYRPQYDQERYNRISPLYYRNDHTTAEKDVILQYAIDALHDNPLDLEQLKYRVYVYEQKRKDNLCRIWRAKLNGLLKVIASSGTGADPDNAWVVVYPANEFSFLNMQGLTVTGQEFREPFYEYMQVRQRRETDPEGYYFNLQPMLDQYYMKHPTER